MFPNLKKRSTEDEDDIGQRLNEASTFIKGMISAADEKYSSDRERS